MCHNWKLRVSLSTRRSTNSPTDGRGGGGGSTFAYWLDYFKNFETYQADYNPFIILVVLGENEFNVGTGAGEARARAAALFFNVCGICAPVHYWYGLRLRSATTEKTLATPTLCP